MYCLLMIWQIYALKSQLLKFFQNSSIAIKYVINFLRFLNLYHWIGQVLFIYSHFCSSHFLQRGSQAKKKKKSLSVPCYSTLPISSLSFISKIYLEICFICVCSFTPATFTAILYMLLNPSYPSAQLQFNKLMFVNSKGRVYFELFLNENKKV